MLIAGACSAPHCSTVDGTLPASANSSPSLQYLQPPAEASTGMLSRATAMAVTASSPNTTTGQPARASPRRPPSSSRGGVRRSVHASSRQLTVASSSASDHGRSRCTSASTVAGHSTIAYPSPNTAARRAGIEL